MTVLQPERRLGWLGGGLARRAAGPPPAAQRGGHGAASPSPHQRPGRQAH